MLQIIDKQDLDRYFTPRAGETKLGQTVRTVQNDSWEDDLAQSSARYVLLGIPEDIGVRANFGVGGANTLWEAALCALLSIQDTAGLRGSNLFLLGAFDCSSLMSQSVGINIESLRELVAQIDDLVYPVIQKIVACGKIPIVVGGGHNNAYPILKGASKARGQALNAINLDAHSDYRMQEGRHSGNGFRYAKKEGYLKRYSVIGLHRNYNSETVLSDMQSDNDIQFSFFEDIFLHQSLSFEEAISDAIRHNAGASTGIELDFDCIEGILSSAMTPSGIAAIDARRYIVRCAQQADVAYLHLTEGAVKLDNGAASAVTAKLAAYFISDFIRE